ncbi:MAG: Ig-like domain-containing protein, partial [Myxococcales bacterium]
EKRDAHPRLGGTTAPIAGSWTVGGAAVTATSCPTGPAEAPYSCKPGQPDDPCLAVFTPDATLAWSSTVQVTLKGGTYAAGEALTSERFVSSSRVTTRGGTLTTDVTFDFRVQDPPPLQVLNVLPGSVGGDLRIAPATLLRDGAIVVKLSEPAACATINAGTVRVTEDADGPAGAAPVAVPTTVAECEGASPGATTDVLTVRRPTGTSYAYSAIVELSLAGGPFGQNQPGAHPGDAVESAIATTRGGQLPQDLQLTFIVEDPPALLVLHTTPGAGSTNAPADTRIDVTFNQPVRIASISGSPAAIRISGVNVFDRATRQRRNLTPSPQCVLSCPDANNDGQSDLVDPANPSLGSTCSCTPLLNGTRFTFDASSAVSALVTTTATSSLTTWRSGALRADYTFCFRTRNPDPLLVAWTSPSDHDSLIPPKMYCDGTGACAAVPAPGPPKNPTDTQVQLANERDRTPVGSDP